LPEQLVEDLRPFLPDFSFRLIQLAQMPFDAIRGTASGVVVMGTLKAERCGKLLDDFVWDEPLLAQIPRALFEAFVLYLSNADVDNQSLERNSSAIENPELRNTAMTLAQKLRQEGRQEGQQEGRQQGRLAVLRENVLEALELRYESVPEGLADGIHGISDEEKLRALHRHAIRCVSLEDFALGL
jgi:hypothetical protein